MENYLRHNYPRTNLYRNARLIVTPTRPPLEDGTIRHDDYYKKAIKYAVTTFIDMTGREDWDDRAFILLKDYLLPHVMVVMKNMNRKLTLFDAFLVVDMYLYFLLILFQPFEDAYKNTIIHMMKWLKYGRREDLIGVSPDMIEMYMRGRTRLEERIEKRRVQAIERNLRRIREK